MNNNQTIEKLKQMRLRAMAELHYEHVKSNGHSDMTADEYLALLIDHQWEDRQNRKIDRLLKQANFRQQATLEDVNYTHNRNLDKNMFIRLATLDFIERKENIIICGLCGSGKSYLSQALGHKACIMEYKTMYTNTARLLKKLKLSKVDGTYLKELEKILKTDLLILDDFGLQGFDNHARDALMDIIDDRYNRKSTIIATQIPVSAWYEIIGGDGTQADALLDRIVNSSHRIDLNTGESLRKRKLNSIKA